MSGNNSKNNNIDNNNKNSGQPEGGVNKNNLKGNIDNPIMNQSFLGDSMNFSFLNHFETDVKGSLKLLTDKIKSNVAVDIKKI